MIWLTWRQFRIQAWVAVVFAAVVAAALAATGPALYDLYRSSGFADCTADCGEIARNFTAQATDALNTTLYVVGTGALLLLPGLVGIFWGAPMVAREVETGTHRLVWNQTVSRRRWLVVKLVTVGLATVVVAVTISAVVTWWTVPLDEAGPGRMYPAVFSARGVVPIGYAAVGFVAGVVIGMVVRRAIPAMAVTLLAVALVQAVVPFVVREHLVTPVSATAAFDPSKIEQLGIHPDNRIDVTQGPPVRGAWVLSNTMAGPDGKEYHGPSDPVKCGRAGGPQECEQWLAGQNLRQEVTYIPPDKFWALQWREFGLLAVIAVLLSVFSLWWIQRRVA
ncbi:transporter [Paractinoplanes deccanensis]|uniref:Transporter n=1 Tax=Paractinoplanes deccanensis TaxID=113561 RepID=A0ABQ3XZQ9_9ACTN|nr:ABC transporter permease subunit [Actinoplanes deccanensis]GID73238.1 transporter [Actinoplanes deccanensis]